MAVSKIKNHSNLLRSNGAIINKDDDEYQKRLNAIRRQEEMDELKSSVKSLESDILEIKEMLSLLIRNKPDV